MAYLSELLSGSVTRRGPTRAGRREPMLAKVHSIPVEVVRWSGGNQTLENLVMDEKKTTPVTPVNTYAA